MATREDVNRWIEHAKEFNIQFIISVCDTFDYSDYPIYCKDEKDLKNKYKIYDGENMQKINEVIRINKDKSEEGLNKYSPSLRNLLGVLIILLLLFIGCKRKYPPDYNYQWTIKVTYTNGDIDTVECGRDSFKGNPVFLWLKTSSNGALVSGGTTPCLFVSCGLYKSPIVCGVRKYEILSKTKSPLEKN